MRYLYTRSKLGSQNGAVAITVAILLVALIGFAAMAIDIGYLLTTRNELQNVADAAALAAARKLGNNYQQMGYGEQLGYDCQSSNYGYTCEQIILVAKQVGFENQAAQTNIVIDDGDVEIGIWAVGATPQFTPQTLKPNAVRVTARRDEKSNSPIATFLAGAIGVDTMSASAQATAALTGQGSVEEGDLELPVGISNAWFDEEDGFCNNVIRFAPSNSPDSCAGWTAWRDEMNDSLLREILDPEDPKYTLSPPLTTGDVINIKGGKQSQLTFEALESLFQQKGYDVKKVNDEWVAAGGEDAEGEPIPGPLEPPLPVVPICARNDDDPPYDSEGNAFYPCDPTHTVPLLYPDGTPKNRHHWDTKVVIYDCDDCENPHDNYAIVGFAEIRLTEVQLSPNKSIVGKVICEKKDTGLSRGGGGEYGTYGSIPGLVE